jgi:hypothetical protein
LSGLPVSDVAVFRSSAIGFSIFMEVPLPVGSGSVGVVSFRLRFIAVFHLTSKEGFTAVESGARVQLKVSEIPSKARAVRRSNPEGCMDWHGARHDAGRPEGTRFMTEDR